jgi:hypothetical protein
VYTDGVDGSSDEYTLPVFDGRRQSPAAKLAEEGGRMEQKEGRQEKNRTSRIT